MRVLFDTYPWAFVTPGGGEQQLIKYAEHLPRHGVEVVLHDHWHSELESVDAVHFFSCIGGSIHFCNYVRERGLPLVGVEADVTLARPGEHGPEGVDERLLNATIEVMDSKVHLKVHLPGMLGMFSGMVQAALQKKGSVLLEDHSK